MTPRETLTRNVLDMLPNELKIPYDRALALWWVNPRLDGGFRLTIAGLEIFTHLDVENWKIELPAINSYMLLELDRKLSSPYFLDTRKRRLITFGGKEATLAMLYGDVKRWLTALQNREY